MIEHIDHIDHIHTVNFPSGVNKDQQMGGSINGGVPKMDAAFWRAFFWDIFEAHFG